MAGNVVFLAISGNPIEHGAIVISTQNNGLNIDTKDNFIIPNPPDTGSLDRRFGSRMDHPRYYTAPS